jgi:hypothetical protein
MVTCVIAEGKNIGRGRILTSHFCPFFPLPSLFLSLSLSLALSLLYPNCVMTLRRICCCHTFLPSQRFSLPFFLTLPLFFLTLSLSLPFRFCSLGILSLSCTLNFPRAESCVAVEKGQGGLIEDESSLSLCGISHIHI